MKNTPNNMNRKSALVFAGAFSMAVAGSANGQAAGNGIENFVRGYSSPAQKIQAVSGTVQTGKRMSQAGQQAVLQLGNPLGVDLCGSETLTQSTNETFIDSNSVWCGSLETSAETSLARGFIAASDLTLKCVTFGISENIGGAANVNVRVLVGSPTSAYADLTLVSETVVSVADNTAFALFTAEIGDVQVPAGSQYIVELNTPSRVLGLGGDGGLLSFGTNTLGQSGPTYLRGPECALNDFVDVAGIGFGNRHLVMSLGYDNGIVPTIQGGFPMTSIGNAVMSQLGDDLVIAGDPNGSGFGVAIDYGTANAGIGATFSVLKDNLGDGTTVSMSFVGETQVNTLRLSDYLGDTSTAVLDLDFDSSGFETFDVWVLKDGELVGILEDQTSGSVTMNATTEGPGECIFWRVGDWQFWTYCEEWTISGGGQSITFPVYGMGVCEPGTGGVDVGTTKNLDTFYGDTMLIVPPDDDTPNPEGPVALNITGSGVSAMSLDLIASPPTVAIGDALSAPYNDEFGELLTAQVGVSFSLYGTDSDALLTGEDVDGDGLADLTVGSPSGSFAVDMMLGGVESASIGIDTVSGIWPPTSTTFNPFGPPINDGPGGCSPYPGGCFPEPFGDFEIGPWGVDQWSVNPDFTGMVFDTVAYEFFLNGEPVGPAIGGEGIMGGTSEMATRAGVFSGDDYGFEAYYPAGTMFTTNDGTVFEVDEIQMIAVGAIGPESLSFMRIGADITDEDATDVRISLFVPETVLTDFNLCPADLTGEGDLNFLDVSAFLQGFGNQDPAADFNGDGDFNFLDVSAFLQAFGAGCP